MRKLPSGLKIALYVLLIAGCNMAAIYSIGEKPEMTGWVWYTLSFLVIAPFTCLLYVNCVPSRIDKFLLKWVRFPRLLQGVIVAVFAIYLMRIGHIVPHLQNAVLLPVNLLMWAMGIAPHVAFLRQQDGLIQ